MSTINKYKEFMHLNPEVAVQFELFLNKNKELIEVMAAKTTGELAKILNGKNKGFTGHVEFIGFTRFDRQFGSNEKSVCLKNSEGLKVWTKVHNTQVQIIGQ